MKRRLLKKELEKLRRWMKNRIQKNLILFFEYKKRSHRYDEAFFILTFFGKSSKDYFSLLLDDRIYTLMS